MSKRPLTDEEMDRIGEQREREGKAWAAYPELCPICNVHLCDHDDATRMVEYWRFFVSFKNPYFLDGEVWG